MEIPWRAANAMKLYFGEHTVVCFESFSTHWKSLTGEVLKVDESGDVERKDVSSGGMWTERERGGNGFLKIIVGLLFISSP